MKLYATLETSRGKTVSISDNEQIVATLYDGNLKAYAVTIEWTVVGDSEHIECNNCGWQGDGTELMQLDPLGNEKEVCPECGLNSKGKLMTVPAVMGAIVTTREWRNQPDDRRKAQAN